LKISQAGLNLIKQFECERDAKGHIMCPLVAYAATNDEAKRNIYTIGYGNTKYADGKPVKKGDTITQDQAEALYASIIAKFESELAPIIKTITLTQNQYDALVSFVYNVGVPEFVNSKTTYTHFKQGNLIAFANDILSWNKQSGKVIPGLTNRRIAERKLFLKE
jgi:lysozyme